MPLLEQFLSAPHLKALAAMLFHSLWQGIVLAALAGVVLLITKKSAASLRYNLLVSLVFIFAASSIYTYLNYLPGSSIQMTDSYSASPLKQYNSKEVVASQDIISNTTELFHSHSGIIVFCWMLIVLIRLGFIISSYYRVHIIKKQLVSPPQQWNERWSALTEQLNIQVPVRLMESALATVPMVIGHFRPLVLIPVGMLLSLPPEQSEAILLHELAHIKRRDYLINLLQSIVESVFCFHPAVTWVCSLINEEREHCCDDIAASHNNEKLVYINALISCYEKALPPATVLSFRGRKFSLLSRIKRLIHHRNKTLNIMEKFFLTIGLVVACFLVNAYQHSNASVQQKVAQTAIDTLPKGNKEVEMKKKDEAAAEASRAMTEAKAAMQDAKVAIEEAKKEINGAEKKLKRSADNDDDIVSEEAISNIVNKAMKDAENAMKELKAEGVTGNEIMQEVQKALKEAQQELREAQIELRGAAREEKDNAKELAVAPQGDELAALTQEVVTLALNAAQLGLQEANAELRGYLEPGAPPKMDKKEYRRRKKELREAYKGK